MRRTRVIYLPRREVHILQNSERRRRVKPNSIVAEQSPPPCGDIVSKTSCTKATVPKVEGKTRNRQKVTGGTGNLQQIPWCPISRKNWTRGFAEIYCERYNKVCMVRPAANQTASCRHSLSQHLFSPFRQIAFGNAIYGPSICANSPHASLLSWLRLFRTIMSYWTSCFVPRINYFSNPDVSYPPDDDNGKPTGTATEDNARTIEDNMVSIFHFSCREPYGGLTVNHFIHLKGVR